MQPGRPELRVPGRLVHRAVDDGSLSGTELVEGARMQARESTTGDRLWQTDRYTTGPVLVLRGLVYCTSGDRPAQVVAFDGRSGSVVWSADVGTFDQEARLMTDGRVLLVGLTPELGEAAGALVALSLTDGGRLWRSRLRTGSTRRGRRDTSWLPATSADAPPSVVLGSP